MLHSKAFSFEANCKALEVVVKKVQSVLAASVTPSFFIAVHKKQVCVLGISGDTFAMVAIPEAKSTAGAFGFDPQTLLGLIRGRNELEFSFNGQECIFKQVKGPYKGNIVTTPITGDQEASCETFMTGGKKIDAVLPADILSLLKIGLVSTNIKDVYLSTTLMSFIQLDKKGKLSVSSFDSQHFGLFDLDTGVKGLQFQAALPATHFSTIEQIAAGTEAKFSVSGGNLRVEGKGFTIVLPSTQAEETHYSMVSSFIESLSKPVFSCTYDSAKIATLTDNLFTLYTANTSFEMSAKDASSTLAVSFTTPSGTASDAMKVTPIKGSKAFKASVDPRLFKDILALSKSIKEPELAVEEKVVILQGNTAEDAFLFLACARAS